MNNNLTKNNQLLSCFPYAEQPSNLVNEKGNCESNLKATISLKSLALKVLQSNQQSNYQATALENQSNLKATNSSQKLHDFIFKTYGITITQIQKFTSPHLPRVKTCGRFVCLGS